MTKTLTAAFAALILALFTALPAHAATSAGIAWKSYSEGVALAKETGKKIYVNFHADWCTYCVKMGKETFVDKKVIAFLNDEFVAISVDTEKESDVASKYKVRGLPTHLFLESDGSSIGAQPGFLDAKQFVKLLKFIQDEKYKQ